MERFAFHAGEEILGMDARYVYRVVDDAKVAPIPLSPKYHIGLTYYRGELFNVIDIGLLLGHEKTDMKPNLPIILIKWSDQKLAIVSEKIVGLMWMEDKEGKHPPTEEGDNRVRTITPDFIWDTLLKNINGSDEISKDFHRGV